MLKYEDALERILKAVPQDGPEPVALNQAAGRVLVENISSPIDLPPFDNSAMDGYAVRANDVAGATAESPIRLRLVGKIAAGDAFSGEVTAGTCVRLFTGSFLPAGADAVVMQEDTKVESAEPDVIRVLDRVKPWENLRFRGEDIKRGAVLAQSGQFLTVGKLCLLTAVGTEQVRVGKCPVVGLLATGSELKEPGQPLAPGQIYESNRIGLATLARQAGALPRIFPIVLDNLAATRSALEDALASCDMLITSGGASVGEMDFIRRALAEAGGELQFWKVAIKPGRPFFFGQLKDKFLFGLPGNPVSAFVTFLLLVRPALLRWQGALDVSLPQVHGLLAEPLANPGGRRHFFRVKADPAGKVYSSGLQASHVLGSLASANGLVDVPPKSTLPV